MERRTFQGSSVHFWPLSNASFEIRTHILSRSRERSRKREREKGTQPFFRGERGVFAPALWRVGGRRNGITFSGGSFPHSKLPGCHSNWPGAEQSGLLPAICQRISRYLFSPLPSSFFLYPLLLLRVPRGNQPPPPLCDSCSRGCFSI